MSVTFVIWTRLEITSVVFLQEDGIAWLVVSGLTTFTLHILPTMTQRHLIYFLKYVFKRMYHYVQFIQY